MRILLTTIMATATLLCGLTAQAKPQTYSITANNDGDSNGPPVGAVVTVWLAPMSPTAIDCQATAGIGCTQIGTLNPGQTNVDLTTSYDTMSEDSKVSVWVQESTSGSPTFYTCTYGYPIPLSQITIWAHMGGCLGQS